MSCDIDCGSCKAKCSFYRWNAFENASSTRSGVEMAPKISGAEIATQRDARRRAVGPTPHPAGGSVWPPLGNLGK